MRLQPGMTVVIPADFEQARSAILASWDCRGPVYYGIGKDEHYKVPGLEGRFELGKAQVVREGKDLVLLGMGNAVPDMMEAAQILATRGLEGEVVVVASLAPAPTKDFEDLFNRFKTVVTVESHYVTGGLGSLAAEVIADHGLSCRLLRCGVRRSSPGLSGSRNYLHALHGLTGQKISEAVLTALSQTV
jgi:transketolase